MLVASVLCFTIFGCNATPIRKENESLAYYRGRTHHRPRTVRRPRHTARKADSEKSIATIRYRFVAVPIIDWKSRVDPIPLNLDFGPWLNWNWDHYNPRVSPRAAVLRLRALDHQRLDEYERFNRAARGG